MSYEILDCRNANGHGWNFYRYDGFLRHLGNNMLPEEDIKMLNAVQKSELRSDDILMVAYAKCGTHWLWEIINMIRMGKAEYHSGSKEVAMLGRSPSGVANLDKLPSPRILNSHLNYRYLPDLITKKIKTVHILRNPKDVVVSFYNKTYGLGRFNGTFSEFLDLFLEGKVVGASYFDYIRDWQQVAREHQDLSLLTIFYEDLKKKPQETVKAIANFLECPIDDGLCSEIVDACSFNKLKAASKDKEGSEKKGVLKWKEGHGMYRKGEVGDWKNWLTVAQNEKFDYILDKEMKDIPFTFTFQ